VGQDSNRPKAGDSQHCVFAETLNAEQRACGRRGAKMLNAANRGLKVKQKRGGKVLKRGNEKAGSKCHLRGPIIIMGALR